MWVSGTKSMCMSSETMEQGGPCSKKDGTPGVQVFQQVVLGLHSLSYAALDRRNRGRG